MLWAIVVIEVLLAIRVLVRMLRSARGVRLEVDPRARIGVAEISVIVPVLNEFGRLGTCLERLVTCGPEVGEILIVDGGSTDGTDRIVASFAACDARIRAVNAAPVPAGWNGKAWGLECGLRSSSAAAQWIVTIDADVRIRPLLPAAMVAWAQRCKLRSLSIATRQELGDRMMGVLHPAMLATLVYRYGLPGNATSRVLSVQANGQCFLASRALLVETNAFATARASVCEDVTIARVLAAAGQRVGFYEAGDLAVVRMHETWQQTWHDWPRSLTLRDRFTRASTFLGLAEIVFVQALPLAVVASLLLTGLAQTKPVPFALNFGLVLMRAGVMAGTRRAYRNPAWTYWLSIIADIPVAAALIYSALRRRHAWRGRTLVVSERIT